MTLTLYGIPNCETMKKARAWLEGHNLPYTFHDYHKLGIDTGTLRRWCATLGHERLVNRRGTTWRRLPEADRGALQENEALRLMMNHPALIKRPVLDADGQLFAGFDEREWQSLL